MSKLIDKDKAILRAEVLIHTSIELYYNKNYICAVPLAAAADDSLGQRLINESKKPALHKLQESIKEKTLDEKEESSSGSLDYNALSTSIKHGRDYPHEETEEVYIRETITFIGRAISNFLICTDDITDIMHNFCIKDLFAYKIKTAGEIHD